MIMMKTKVIAISLIIALILGVAFVGIYTRRGGTLTTACTSSVSTVNGVPTLLINGQPRATTSFCVYNVEGTSPYSSTSLWSDYIHQVKEAGLTYLTFNVGVDLLGAGQQQPATPGKDLDFGALDAIFDMAAAEGVFIMPSIDTSNPPAWWSEQNKNALQTSYDGHRDGAVSFNNPSYWEVADAYLTAIIEHYKDHPALLGWTIRVGVTGESNYGPSYLENIYNPSTSWCDYSQHAKSQFRAWLTEKYGTNSALRAAWDNSTVTLTTAEPPMPLSEAASQPISEAIEYANGSGDNRRMMLDWLHFRLDEKYAEWKHFVDLANQLDPNHVITIDPASRPVQGAPETVRTGRTDSCFLHSLPGVDIVIRNPRLGPDESSGSFNTSSTSLYQSAIYARLRGKISTWAFEDTGSLITGHDVNSSARVENISRMLASAGGGTGWVTGDPNVQTKYGVLPIWSEAERVKIAEMAPLFDPAQRQVESMPRVAALLDPWGDLADYQGGTPEMTRSQDRLGFLDSLAENGLKITPLTTDDVKGNQNILNQFDAVLVVHLARLDPAVAQTLADYRDGGGGLFIAGRTGIFDNFGRENRATLQILLGLTTDPQDSSASADTWSFDVDDHQLLTGLAGTKMDTKNLYRVPAANWASAGYTELGHTTGGTSLATVLIKGKTVVWFPRLDVPNAVEFASNLWSWWGL